MTERNSGKGSSNTGRSRTPRLGARPAEAIDESPLAVLAAGVAAGALIASLLPVSRQEKKLLAPVGDRVTTAARGAADAARQAGSDKLRELGLSPDAVAEKVSEAGRATAQAALSRFRDDSGNS